MWVRLLSSCFSIHCKLRFRWQNNIWDDLEPSFSFSFCCVFFHFPTQTNLLSLNDILISWHGGKEACLWELWYTQQNSYWLCWKKDQSRACHFFLCLLLFWGFLCMHACVCVCFGFVLYLFFNILFHFVFLSGQNAPTCSKYLSLVFSKVQKERFIRFPWPVYLSGAVFDVVGTLCLLQLFASQLKPAGAKLQPIVLSTLTSCE